MAKIAIVVLTNSDSPEGRGRMVHAMTAAKELLESGEEVKILFEGIGVMWLEVFHKSDNPFAQRYGPTFEAIKETILGTCNFCTVGRFSVGDSADAFGIALLGDNGQHFSVGKLIAEGYQIITY